MFVSPGPPEDSRAMLQRVSRYSGGLGPSARFECPGVPEEPSPSPPEYRRSPRKCPDEGPKTSGVPEYSEQNSCAAHSREPEMHRGPSSCVAQKASRFVAARFWRARVGVRTSRPADELHERNRYAPNPGTPDARRAIIERVLRNTGGEEGDRSNASCSTRESSGVPGDSRALVGCDTCRVFRSSGIPEETRSGHHARSVSCVPEYRSSGGRAHAQSSSETISNPPEFRNTGKLAALRHFPSCPEFRCSGILRGTNGYFLANAF